MRRTFLSIAVALWLAAGFSYADEDLGYVPGMVVVRFTPSAMPSREAVGMAPAAFQKPDLDNILREHGAFRLSRFLRTFGEETSPAGRLLDRTFVICYEDGTDAQLVVAELSALPYFESVAVNHRLRKYYGGTLRFQPTDTNFPSQWNLDYASDDRVDIDARDRVSDLDSDRQ